MATQASLFTDKQLLVGGGLLLVALYIASKKAAQVAGDVFNKVNPVSEDSFIADIPAALAEATKSREGSWSDQLRIWWHTRNELPPAPPSEQSPDIIGHNGDIPIVN